MHKWNAILTHVLTDPGSPLDKWQTCCPTRPPAKHCTALLLPSKTRLYDYKVPSLPNISLASLSVLDGKVIGLSEWVHDLYLWADSTFARSPGTCQHPHNCKSRCKAPHYFHNSSLLVALSVFMALSIHEMAWLCKYGNTLNCGIMKTY